MTPAEPRGVDLERMREIAARSNDIDDLGGTIFDLCTHAEFLAAEVARYERVANAARDWEAMYRGHPVPGKRLSSVMTELAEAVAALGTKGAGDGD